MAARTGPCKCTQVDRCQNGCQRQKQGSQRFTVSDYELGICPRSSVGQSSGFLNRRSQVRILPGVLTKPSKQRSDPEVHAGLETLIASPPRYTPISARVYVTRVSAVVSPHAGVETAPRPLTRRDRANSRCLCPVPTFGLSPCRHRAETNDHEGSQL